MKPGLKFLNSKEVKEIKKLKDQFGFEGDLDYAFLMNESNKVNVVSRSIDAINLDLLRINSIGVYFCELKENELRLSVEGSQIVGPNAKKNVIELDRQKAREWVKGYDVEYPGETKGFVIIKCGNDFMGCAKHKENKLINHVPKERRIRATD